MKELIFNINVSKLKGMGYTFQKLYAADYKTYRKKIGDYTIWLWVKGRLIEVDDWHQHTNSIIEFYKNNLEKHISDNKDLPKPSDFMRLRIHEETSEVIFKDMQEYYQHLMDFGKKTSEKDKIKTIEDYETKYENYRNVVIYIPKFQTIINEIDLLTCNVVPTKIV